MFESLGLFKEVLCPEDSRCTFINCIFAHTDKQVAPQPAVETKNTTSTPAKPPTKQSTEEPQPKRRRLDTDTGGTTKRLERATKQENANPSPVPKAHGVTAKKDVSFSDARNLNSMKRAVSPPTGHNSPGSGKETKGLTRLQDGKENAGNGDTKLVRQTKKESLNPRHLSKPPAAHAIRMSILVKLHGAMVKLNDQMRKDKDQSKKKLVLTSDELILMSLDEEEKIAKESPSVYSNVIKLRITKLMKMKQEDWEQAVLNFLRPKMISTATNSVEPLSDKSISTGLGVEEEITVLSTLITPFEGIQKLGYVTAPPSDEEVTAASQGTNASQGWEKCDRCNGRFQVFPGRREDGAVTSGGPCSYHYAKPSRPSRKKTDQIVGHKEAYYPCCKETVGTSAGCTKAESHVFKVSEAKRLAATLQYEKTPFQPEKGTLPPVCFDCEMGYTTLGLELIRLTAISWPEGKPVIDVLVRPIGEVLDLNTRYSGVNPEHFTNALPYKPSPTPQPKKDGTGASDSPSQGLRIVESPSAARALLFEYLQPETPLIGHALENDLNACRIIHHTVVDTAFLYPHPAGLPVRFGLRGLAKRFLDRDIQVGGGNHGHDSIEDAKATGDLVRVKVREKWKELKRLGWEMKNGELMQPADSSISTSLASKTTKAASLFKKAADETAAGPGILGAGAGAKRKSYDRNIET